MATLLVIGQDLTPRVVCIVSSSEEAVAKVRAYLARPGVSHETHAFCLAVDDEVLCCHSLPPLTESDHEFGEHLSWMELDQDTSS